MAESSTAYARNPRTGKWMKVEHLTSTRVCGVTLDDTDSRYEEWPRLNFSEFAAMPFIKQTWTAES